MKTFFQNWAVSFSMYSKIPMPHFEWNNDNMKYSMCFFPLVGVVIGFVQMWARYFCVHFHMSQAFTGVILTLIPVVISGGIHLDGLLDTADALSSNQPKERKLEILKDSHAGAFAIITGVCYFLLDFAFMSEVSWLTVYIIAVGYMVSRGLSGFAVVTFKCAKNSGLVATFSDMSQRMVVRVVSLIYVIIGYGLMIFISPLIGGIAILASLLVFLYYRVMSYRQFGGINGDLAGFFLQICELAIVMAAVVGEKICYLS
ncbi:MAG: adenosylcobinamide-GDP ribazoletransferase [Lachnospiraceae bacterium]|nr:adenosylcobinamide-GDP ribazoletransferase [Lachnospiraceae bacterium]